MSRSSAQGSPGSSRRWIWRGRATGRLCSTRARSGIGASSRNAGYVGRTFKYTFGELLASTGSTMPSPLSRTARMRSRRVASSIGDEKIDCGFGVQGRFIMAASPGQCDALRREFDLRAKHLGDEFALVARDDSARARSPPISITAASSSPTWRDSIPASITRAFSIARGAPALGSSRHTPVQAIRRDGGSFELATARGAVLGPRRHRRDQWLYRCGHFPGCSAASFPSTPI